MTTGVRLTVEDIFQTAADLAPDARAAYLDEVCGDDQRLRREVEELLRFDAPDENFLERPAFQDAARNLAHDLTVKESTLAEAGRMLGPYRILGELGRGGMGVVYLAFDTRDERQVAIKVLPKHFIGDEDRMARFTREARMLSELKRLKHPNIAEIYEQAEHDGKPIIALEYVPGDTLADRLEAGSLPIGEALQIAVQIADALSSAHAQQIVHRDLKPANIKITPEGRVKVLDFGLAKHFQNELADADLQTRSLSLTESGMLMGTPAYMSPEQWNGRAVDQRTDIWALGCLLYEMLTGRDPFSGRNRAETMKAVFEASPDWRALPAATPLTVQDLIRRSLQRDPAARLRDAGEARRVLAEAITKNRFALLLYIKAWVWKISRKTKVRVAAALIGLLVGTSVAYNIYNSVTKSRVVFNQSDDLTAILPRYAKRWTPELVRAAVLNDLPSSQDLLASQQELVQNQISLTAAEDVIREFKQRAEAEPESAQYQAILAQAYVFKYFVTHNENERKLAVETVNKAKSLAAASGETPVGIQVAIGQVLMAVGLPNDAVALLEKSRAQRPNDPEVLLWLANAYRWSSGGDGVAEKYYLQSIEATVRNGERPRWIQYNDLADYYLTYGRLEQATANFRKVIEADGSNPIGYTNLGMTLFMQGCVAEALNNFTKAVNLAPIAESYYNLGSAQIYLGQYPAAIQTLEYATKQAGAHGIIQSAWSWANLGDAYSLSGNKEEAAAAYQQAITLAEKDINPGRVDPMMQALKAEMIAKLNQIDPQSGRADPVKMIEETLKPEYVCIECFGKAVLIYYLTGNKEKALRAVQPAVENGYSLYLLLSNPELKELWGEREFQRLRVEFHSNC